MRIESVRDLKAELAAKAVLPAGEVAQDPGPQSLALGVAVLGHGRYGLAVRYRLGTSGVRALVRRLVDDAGESAAVDVRRIGRLRPLLAPTGRQVAVVGARGRVRPLRPGLSIGHPAVTAGTLGGFVVVDGAVHALSNGHVLADSGRAAAGDPVLQPGIADGGSEADRVGVLAGVVPLRPEGVNHADAALARLDDDVAAQVDPTYPAGRLTGTVRARGEEVVEKVGRTTGVTRGYVSAIEVDDVVVDYGDGVGPVRFDDQVEVSGAGDGPFSRGGDSGSLVYERGTRRALGLLFAGSESGGDNGAGLTYCNPVDDALRLLGATLLD
jgi:hypothetical protein